MATLNVGGRVCFYLMQQDERVFLPKMIDINLFGYSFFAL